MQDKLISRILLVLLAGFTIGYTVYIVVRYLTPGYRTETAYSYTVSDSCRIRAVAVRDEQVLTSSVTGSYSYIRGDGDIVLASSVVADVYQSADDLHLERQITEWENEISTLKTAQNTDVSTLSDTLSTELNEATGALNGSVAVGDLSELSQTRRRIQLLTAKRLISSGKQSDFSERISELENKISDARSNMSTSTQHVTAGAAGYFSSLTDGYENALPFDLDALTAADVRGVAEGSTQSKVYENAIGKVQHGFRWYLASAVDSATAEKFKEGASVTLDFGVSGATEIPAQVVLVRDEGTVSLVVLCCERISSYLINVRTATLDIRFHSYTGLIVNSEAVRYIGQTEGVYVKSGNLVEFKQINRIYDGGSFILCEEKADLENPLEQFDEVIVAGSDLYDGKVLS